MTNPAPEQFVTISEQAAYERGKLPMGQPGTYAVTPRQPWTLYQRKQAKLVAAVIGGPAASKSADS